MHAQLRKENFSFLPGEGSWPDVLTLIRREAEGVAVPPGRVRADFLIAEVEGVPVGRVSIRHMLNDHLLAFGGHLGYAVAPGYRRRGYATRILRESLTRLASLGVPSALVTCNDDNVASIGVIEACGGELEDVRTAPGNVSKRRYWIDTGEC